MQISACVITLNEADRIEACLRSLAFCDEIVVVDSGSSDATLELARAQGAVVLQRAFSGYRSQKQFAVDSARYDWVLCLDADESVSEDLRTSIEAARASGFRGASAYRFARANWYFGRALRHGNAWPDHVLRLFNRREGRWSGYEVHESVRTAGAVRTLAGCLDHRSYRSLSDQLQRNARYARMMAAGLYTDGRRAHVHNLILNPLWRFLRGYVRVLDSSMAGADSSTRWCASSTCRTSSSPCGCCRRRSPSNRARAYTMRGVLQFARETRHFV